VKNPNKALKNAAETIDHEGIAALISDADTIDKNLSSTASLEELANMVCQRIPEVCIA
jgi:hypothetical protein